ncbi:MAG: AAA family ATPase, partial [Spirulinaceae cyanobacterium]
MHFKSIEINEWQQFEHVHIEFHDRLTILTGANGSGKTTILDILSQHCNWIYIPLAIPKRVNGSEKMKFMPRFFDGMDKGSDTKIGCLVYSNDQQSKLNIYTESKVARYSITIHSQLPVDCFYITSHPSAFQYNEMHKMPAEGQDREEVFRLVYDAISDKYLGRSTEQPVFLMKEVLMSWEIEENGMGNNGSRISSSDQNEVRLLEGFQGVLRKVLPSSLGFKNIE